MLDYQRHLYNFTVHSNLLIHCDGLKESVSRLLLHSPNPIPLYVPKWSYWSKFKFRIPHWPNLSF